MKYGRLADVQRPSFGFRYSFGESHGFSGSEETQLISDTIIAQDLGPEGAILPESPGHVHLIGLGLSGGSQFLVVFSSQFLVFSELRTAVVSGLWVGTACGGETLLARYDAGEE